MKHRPPQRQKFRDSRPARASIGVLLVLVLACNSPKSATPGGAEETGRTRAAAAPTPSPAAPVAIEGTVRVSGKLPALPPLRASEAVAKVCGTQIPDRTVAASQTGGLADAVVFLAGAGPGPPPAAELAPAVVDQRRCEYWPPVLALRAGQEIEIRNSDPLLHNVRAKDSGPLFNFAMPVQGLVVRKALPRSPATIHLGCDVHPWMRAVIRTFDHPHFAITDDAGRYRLPAVPSGRRKLVFWHQRFLEKSTEVDVAPPGPSRVDLEWPAGELR